MDVRGGYRDLLTRVLLAAALLCCAPGSVHARPDRPACGEAFDLIAHVVGDRVDLRKDIGGWFARKEYRRALREAVFDNHGRKHEMAKTAEQAQKLSIHAAQYLPTMNHKRLELAALWAKSGAFVKRPNGAFWKIVRFHEPIGYDQAELTRWIRVEYSSGVYHGHPMSLARVRKYIPDAAY